MKIKAGNDERVWLFFRNIILIGGLLLILCPLWMVLINSFKTLEEAGKNFFALPSKLNLENYIELFTNSNYWIFLKNSFKNNSNNHHFDFDFCSVCFLFYCKKL